MANLRCGFHDLGIALELFVIAVNDIHFRAQFFEQGEARVRHGLLRVPERKYAKDQRDEERAQSDGARDEAGAGRIGGLGTLGGALFQIGAKSAFALMVPALAGYIAYSIASRPGIAPGMVGGMLAATFVAILFVPLFFRLLTRRPASPWLVNAPRTSTWTEPPKRSSQVASVRKRSISDFAVPIIKSSPLAATSLMRAGGQEWCQSERGRVSG